MILKHWQIADLERDPRSFFSRTTAPFAIGFSYSNAVRKAILHYHRMGSMRAALALLSQELQRARNEVRKEVAKRELTRYCVSFESLRCNCFSVGYRLRCSVAPTVTLGGEVPVIALEREGQGYKAWLLDRSTGRWEGQLRMPVIQHCLAIAVGCPLGSISVGVYSFLRSRFEWRTYTEQEVARALARLVQLLEVALETAP